MTDSDVRVSAPTRIDLAGGTLDIWPLSVIVPGAMTINLAVELRASARVRSTKDGRARIVSRDRGKSATRQLPLSSGSARGPLSLLLRIASSFEPRVGFELETLAQAPAGAGLGGSSALGIAVAAAMNRWSGARLGREALLRRGMNLETVELAVPTGNQDYLAALHGGLAAYHHETDGIRREALPIAPELQQRLVLAYTGEPRNSGYSNWDMFRRYVDREPATVERMERIAAIARRLRTALLRGNLEAAGRLIGEEGSLRFALAPSVATRGLKNAAAAAQRAGALGTKVCGAGGGGCLVALARRGRADEVAAAIAGTGAKILPARIARRGVG